MSDPLGRADNFRGEISAIFFAGFPQVDPRHAESARSKSALWIRRVTMILGGNDEAFGASPALADVDRRVDRDGGLRCLGTFCPRDHVVGDHDRDGARP